MADSANPTNPQSAQEGAEKSKERAAVKSVTSIPTGKVARAMKFAGTGAKVGGNYMKYYAKRAVGSDKQKAKDSLHEDNAEDIYGSLAQLKGSALKVAQMLSMDATVLPPAYTDKFQMAQYNAPPLSGPLVIKTFQKNVGKAPGEVFDVWGKEAFAAASIGQVHEAQRNGEKLAVKVQYPGVADSIQSDLKLVKPFAARLFKLKDKEMRRYMREVEDRLVEETDYELELERSVTISKACEDIEGITFAKYYKDLSGPRVLTMSFVEGVPLGEFVKTNKDQELANSLGQTMWDFYERQLHHLKMTHADPHPGNFIVTPDNQLCCLDFGCVKEMPDDFHADYFALINPENFGSKERLEPILERLEIVLPTDGAEEKKFFYETFQELAAMLAQPFVQGNFDFSDDAYFQKLFAFGEEKGKIAQKKGFNGARGVPHLIYLNRCHYGLYNILHVMKAKVNTGGVPVIA